jgi:hypothetical protein
MKKIITQLTAVIFVALALGLSAAAQDGQNTRSDQIYGSGSFTDGGVIGSGTAVTGDNGGMIGSGTRTAAPSAGSVYGYLNNWLEGIF